MIFGHQSPKAGFRSPGDLKPSSRSDVASDQASSAHNLQVRPALQVVLNSLWWPCRVPDSEHGNQKSRRRAQCGLAHHFWRGTKCIFSQRNESGALLTPRRHRGPAKLLLACLLASELVPLHPTVKAGDYTTKAILKETVDHSYCLGNTGTVLDVRSVDLPQQAHRVPKSRGSLLCRRVESANGLRG